MGKTCELCGKRETTLYCSADDAKLCWSCDAVVHSANFLVARHMRSLLCQNCNEETDCQTSGSHPFPLARSCAACDPAYVREDGDVNETILHECNDESENLRAPAPRSAGRNSCSSQDSHSDAHSSVEDDKVGKKISLGGLRAKPKRMKGPSTGGTGNDDTTNRAFVSGQTRRIHTQSIKKSKKKRSGSPVSVISMDLLMSNGTWDDDDNVAEGCGVKGETELLSLLPTRR